MPPTLEELRERARPWVEPVPGTAPAGTQAKHDPAYEAITAEVAKLESPASNAVRWDEVVRGADELLKGTTKDLWLASYLAYGLYVTRGMDGAATGAALLAEVTERFWPDLFPEVKRLRARANAVGWFVERLGRLLPTIDQASVSAESLDALAFAIKRLSTLSRERFADQTPAFGPIQDAIARLRAGLPEPLPEAPQQQDAAPAEPVDTAPTAAPVTGPESSSSPAHADAASAANTHTAPRTEPPASPKTAQPPPPSRPASPQVGAQPSAPPRPASPKVAAPSTVVVPPLPTLPAQPDLSSTEAVTDFLRNVGAALLGAASALRHASSADPVSYRLLRNGVWLHLARPPATGANGRTTLQPPPDSLRSKLETLEANQRWSELLDEAESAVAQHRFALSPHRFSAAALKGLGETHTTAHAALVRELRVQLRRMPGVEDLLAADGSPLTDEATRAWLRAEVLQAAPRTTAASPVRAPTTAIRLPPPSLDAESAGAQPLGEEETQALLAEGRVQELVAGLQADVAAAGTGRARFVARLTLARLCAQAGQLPLARALFDALDEEVSSHALDQWEPTLAAACLEGWLATRTVEEKEGGRLAAKVRNRYRRLARLDSSAALRVVGP
ncbi:TssA family type VI secretion system protein [Myxococcus sp. CA039A]|uniref:TssA family type VI secretion system protein n=1 Tax=Myxococcus sp. CA039A TaxID=2741737 RepID=UPI00157BB0F6|nr:TssA family type VI secretion system protein [Myxococcus sp. CA039A]NTX53896.1 type VI secretion system domain-containing protein [Myxococcus sp. CA039A]